MLEIEKKGFGFLAVLLTCLAILFALALWATEPAHAHVQIYPHMHPHAEASSWEDLMADLAWLALGVVAWLGLLGLGAYLDRRIGK
jgi:hypothetical protein